MLDILGRLVGFVFTLKLTQPTTYSLPSNYMVTFCRNYVFLKDHIGTFDCVSKLVFECSLKRSAPLSMGWFHEHSDSDRFTYLNIKCLLQLYSLLEISVVVLTQHDN